MKPGLWLANGAPTDAAKMLSWRPGAVTCFMDYLGPNRVREYKRDNPETTVIIRFQHPTNWREDVAVSARNHADYVLSKWPEIREMDPFVYFANEMNLHYENGDVYVGHQPQYETPEFYMTYADWVRRTADRIKQQQPAMRLVCPPFAYGHREDGAADDDGNPKEGWAGYDYLADTVRSHFGETIAFHGYWGDASGSIATRLYDPEESSWHAFRWRRLLQLFQTRYGTTPKVIIDEAGNFGASDPDFTEQCCYYAERTLMDPAVMALCFFLWQDPTKSPGNMPNSWVDKCRDLDGHIAALGALDLRPIAIRVYVDGRVETLELEQYLRGVVPAEMGPEQLRILDDPRIPDGPSHAETTHIEALRAQAVLARSCALWRIAHPRHASFDLYANTSDQVWTPATHPRSDQAVRDTAGIYLVGPDGGPWKAEYVSRCGQATCAWCNGAPGYRVTTWPGRACQFGLQALANEGHTWRTISLAYYPDDVRWSDIAE